jgi:hypothetical protein
MTQEHLAVAGLVFLGIFYIVATSPTFGKRRLGKP